MPNKKSSSAYDLSLFEPRKATIVEIKPNKKLEKQKQQAESVKSVFNTLALLFISVFVAAFFGLNITSRVKLTEMDTEIMVCKEELVKLQSENVRLTDELVRETSNKNVEEYAREHLQMEKIKPHQIEYYTINDEDKIVVVEEKPSFFDEILNKIKNIFS